MDEQSINTRQNTNTGTNTGDAMHKSSRKKWNQQTRPAAHQWGTCRVGLPLVPRMNVQEFFDQKRLALTFVFRQRQKLERWRWGFPRKRKAGGGAHATRTLDASVAHEWSNSMEGCVVVYLACGGFGRKDRV